GSHSVRPSTTPNITVLINSIILKSIFFSPPIQFNLYILSQKNEKMEKKTSSTVYDGPPSPEGKAYGRAFFSGDGDSHRLTDEVSLFN
ncbi:MAG: hypothetical protein J6M33_07665, partial [Anaerovibrio sp.]|nr:hypothetical protein [Anaerovibrio sp.]